MKENTEKITREFCKNKNLIFYPKTEEEAAFIQRKIFDMGYDWINPHEERGVIRTKKCVEMGMTLWNGDLYYNVRESDKRGGGLLCTSGQFEEAPTAETEIARRISGLSDAERTNLFMSLKLQFPEDFAAAANPAALTRDLPIKPSPFARKQPYTNGPNF
jgi:hypothetical protein